MRTTRLRVETGSWVSRGHSIPAMASGIGIGGQVKARKQLSSAERRNTHHETHEISDESPSEFTTSNFIGNSIHVTGGVCICCGCLRGMRILLLRHLISGEWKYLIMMMAGFDARKYMGYRYYKSFPNNAGGKEDAKAYARGVEQDEERIQVKLAG